MPDMQDPAVNTDKPVSPLAGLGRLPQKDDRNNRHMMARKLEEAPPEHVPRRRLWHVGTVLDQHDTPQCVGYSGWQFLAAGPVTNKPTFSPTDLYLWAQDNDEWPGRDYDGSSTLGLMKALKDKGYIGEYVWAHDAETLVQWVLAKGPVLVGTNWFMDMFTPDAMDFLSPTGENVGGHEWLIFGADRDKYCPDGSQGACRMVNSWGRGWSDNGRAWVSFKSLDKLIKDDGEAVTVTEIKL